MMQYDCHRSSLRFRPIDLVADRSILLTFARDLFTTSFGDIGWFDRRFGEDGACYVEWLLASTRGVDAFSSFITVGNMPVGMIVVGAEPDEPEIGHVFHYYLAQDARGLGLGAELDEHAMQTLARAGFAVARLNVTSTNLVAIGFYQRHGWEICDNPANGDIISMKKKISAQLC